MDELEKTSDSRNFVTLANESFQKIALNSSYSSDIKHTKSLDVLNAMKYFYEKLFCGPFFGRSSMKMHTFKQHFNSLSKYIIKLRYVFPVFHLLSPFFCSAKLKQTISTNNMIFFKILKHSIVKSRKNDLFVKSTGTSLQLDRTFNQTISISKEKIIGPFLLHLHTGEDWGGRSLGIVFCIDQIYFVGIRKGRQNIRNCFGKSTPPPPAKILDPPLFAHQSYVHLLKR